VSGAIREVVIVGRDAPAWIAAASLQRALGPSGLKVTVVELPSLLSSIDVYPALPSLQSLHALLGIDEAAVLTAANGVPMVAQRYVDWGKAGEAFLHSYDSAETPGAFVSFVQLWTKARLEGLPVAFEEFQPGAMAARLGRVSSESDDPEGLGATYGYHLDAMAYSLLLRAFAMRRGVAAKPVGSVEVEVDGDVIAAIRLPDGERIQADLFIDASGPDALLLSRLPGSPWDSWSNYFPCDRTLTLAAPGLEPRPAFSQIKAFDEGWIGLYPLYNRTVVVGGYNSARLSNQEAAAAILANAGIRTAGEGLVETLQAGIRNSPWVGNCVAIGEAAAMLDPLDAVQLHVAHLCVTNLISFFPVTSDYSLEAEEYGRAIRRHAANLRDFQSAHYKLNGRFGQAFWDIARDGRVSEGLQLKLQMFEARAETILYDEETFEDGSWAAMFLGHGLVPKAYDPRVDLIAQQDHIAAIRRRLSEIAALVPAYPTVDAFLSATRIPVDGVAGAA
jgi:tryptophan halogenase